MNKRIFMIIAIKECSVNCLQIEEQNIWKQIEEVAYVKR